MVRGTTGRTHPRGSPVTARTFGRMLIIIKPYKTICFARVQ